VAIDPNPKVGQELLIEVAKLVACVADVDKLPIRDKAFGELFDDSLYKQAMFSGADMCISLRSASFTGTR
jgi:hypothetical protein